MSPRTPTPDTADLPPLPTSQDHFECIACTYPELRMERTAEGKVIILAPAGDGSGHRNLQISIQLGTWAEQDGTGIAFDSSTGFVLPGGATRSPDASWVELAHWNALTEEQQEKYLPFCPAFALELMSPTDSLPETQEKMREYIANGARLGWLLVPRLKRVEVYRPGQTLEILADPDGLSGEDVLPGFVLNLRRVWG